MESLILGATSTGFFPFLLLFFSRSRASSHGSFTRDSREIARFTSSCPTIRIRIEDARERLEKDPKDECYPDAWLQLSFLRNGLTSRRFSVACKRISKVPPSVHVSAFYWHSREYIVHKSSGIYTEFRIMVHLRRI